MSELKKSDNKFITVRDIYLKYPYKTYDIHSSTIPKPYFPANEISDHKDTLTYKEFRTIVNCYFKHLVNYIKTGREFVVPSNLGIIQLRKYKKKKAPVDFKKTKELYGEINKTLPKGQKKLVRFKNRHSNNRIPIIKWYRKDKKFAFQWHWMFRLTKHAWKNISDELLKDVASINKLNEL